MKISHRHYRHFFLLGAFAASTACGLPTDLASAMPSDDDVELRIPGNSARRSGLTQPLLGETSEFYVHTARVSRGINEHVALLLQRMRQISEYPPSTVEGDTSIWGPHSPGGLDPLNYRFTAVKKGEAHYDVILEARAKQSESEEDFRSLIDGQIFGELAAEGNRGVLMLHLDNRAELDPTVAEKGEIGLRYNAGAVRIVEVDFAQFVPAPLGFEPPAPIDATYRYREAEDKSGVFLFSIDHDIHTDAARGRAEHVTLRSRWQADGAGRADVTLEGEDITAQIVEAGVQGQTVVHATECWDDAFHVVFQDTTPEELRAGVRPLEGDVSACAVAEAQYPETVETELEEESQRGVPESQEPSSDVSE